MKKYWPVLVILLVGLFLRVYKPLELFMYGHDQDLLGWVIKDIVVDHHWRLIGQETSSQGVFIGPLFYYLQIPFYLLTRMDPSGSLILVTILGMFTIFSIYYSFSKMFGHKVGVIATLVYAVGVYFVNTDREVAPTMPVHLWTVWYLYFLWQIYKGKSRAYLGIGFLAGITWNLNLALVIVLPLVVIAQIFSKVKINFKYLVLGIIILLVSMSPFVVFEARHNLRQTRAIVSSLTTSKDYVQGTSSGLAKLDRVFQIVYKNTTAFYWGPNIFGASKLTLYLLVAGFIFLVVKKILSVKFGIILLLWQTAYVLFFTFNSINVSEYYLNGMNVIWLVIYALFVSYLLEKPSRVLKLAGILILFILTVSNLYEFYRKPINRSGYLERKALVAYIKADALQHNYPCVAVSYITSPGNNLGYRYLFWLENMHVNLPASQAPVYSIVYPHSMVNRIDKSFGALGLILPEYFKYNKETVGKACAIENQNLTEPVFGFTQ